MAEPLSRCDGIGVLTATVDSRGRTIFVADAHRDDGKRLVVRADEKLTAFVELESVIRGLQNKARMFRLFKSASAG
jgi:hypothetical protein